MASVIYPRDFGLAVAKRVAAALGTHLLPRGRGAVPAGVRTQYITFDDPASVADPAVLVEYVAAGILEAVGDQGSVRMWRTSAPGFNVELEGESDGVVVSLWTRSAGHGHGKWGVTFAWEAPAEPQATTAQEDVMATQAATPAPEPEWFNRLTCETANGVTVRWIRAHSPVDAGAHREAQVLDGVSYLGERMIQIMVGHGLAHWDADDILRPGPPVPGAQLGIGEPESAPAVSPKERAMDRWAAGEREGMCGACRHRDRLNSSRSGSIFCEAHRVHVHGSDVHIEPGHGGTSRGLEFPAWFGCNLWEAEP